MVSLSSLTLSNIKYQGWNTGLYVLNKLRIRAEETGLSAQHPYIAKAETVRVCTWPRAAITQNKVRTGTALLVKGRRGREEGLDTVPVTTVVGE